ncbi:sulfurase, partial [Pimelobacter simplex]
MPEQPVVAEIHVAKATRLPMQAKDVVEVETGRGIVGDRYHGTRHRHVTVQSRETLDEAAQVYGRPVPSELTRRNLTISHGVVPR